MIKLIVEGVISGEFSNGDNYFQVMCNPKFQLESGRFNLINCLWGGGKIRAKNECVCVWVETRTEMEKMCVSLCGPE